MPYAFTSLMLELNTSKKQLKNNLKLPTSLIIVTKISHPQSFSCTRTASARVTVSKLFHSPQVVQCLQEEIQARI